MSQNPKGYYIVPSKINPKIGLVVNVPDPSSPRKHFYQSFEKRRKFHIQNHKIGFKGEISQIDKNSYKFKAIHLFHYLSSIFHIKITNLTHTGDTLEVEYPPLDGNVLFKFIRENEFLYESIIIQFRMNVMLFLMRFAESHNLETIVVWANKEVALELKMYEEITSLSTIINSNGEKMSMLIDLTKNSSKDWETSMKIFNKELQQELWAEAMSCPEIFEYLKFNPCHDLFC